MISVSFRLRKTKKAAVNILEKNKSIRYCFKSNSGWIYFLSMEYTGFEPVASTMRMLRAPNCANTPIQTAFCCYLMYYNTTCGKREEIIVNF